MAKFTWNKEQEQDFKVVGRLLRRMEGNARVYDVTGIPVVLEVMPNEPFFLCRSILNVTDENKIEYGHEYMVVSARCGERVTNPYLTAEKAIYAANERIKREGLEKTLAVIEEKALAKGAELERFLKGEFIPKYAGYDACRYTAQVMQNADLHGLKSLKLCYESGTEISNCFYTENELINFYESIKNHLI